MPGRCFRKRRVLAFVLFSNRLKFSTFFASNNVENNFYLFDEYIARYLSHITTLYSLYPLCLLFVIQLNLKFELIPEPGSTSISSKISIAPPALRATLKTNFRNILQNRFNPTKQWWHSTSRGAFKHYPDITLQNALATSPLRLLVWKPSLSSWEFGVQERSPTRCSHLESCSCWLRTLLRGDIRVCHEFKRHYVMHWSIPIRWNAGGGHASLESWRPLLCRRISNRIF